MNHARQVATVGILSMLVLAATPLIAGDPAAWEPTAWGSESTVELGVVRPDGTPHWFKVWIVVLDGEPYVRLGARSVAKLDQNRSKPYVGLRVAGREFPHVGVEPVPADAERVAQAMAQKYWSDLLVRLVAHPMTAHLRAPKENP